MNEHQEIVGETIESLKKRIAHLETCVKEAQSHLSMEGYEPSQWDDAMLFAKRALDKANTESADVYIVKIYYNEYESDVLGGGVTLLDAQAVVKAYLNKFDFFEISEVKQEGTLFKFVDYEQYIVICKYNSGCLVH